MPRNDGHNPEKPRRHHKPMHSSRSGEGHDKKIRKAKRTGIFICSFCGRRMLVRRHHKIRH